VRPAGSNGTATYARRSVGDGYAPRVTEESEPGTPEHKQSVRASLAGTLDRWRDAGDLALTPEAGWPLGPPGSSSDTWAVILYVAAGACDAVGRWSEAAIHGNYSDPTRVREHAGRAAMHIERLAAAVLIELGEDINPEQVLAEADAFVDEVVDEDNGLPHACDAIGSLLQARLVCAEDQLELPASELTDAAAKILAPLLAQYGALNFT
jgi:hypothetical protein